MYSINELAANIQQAFEDGLKLEEMGSILMGYDGVDWKDHERFTEISYTRNLVFRNESFEIMVICWNYGQRSCIHDHPENGCFLKVLQGSLVEETYKMISGKPSLAKSSELSVGSIAYQKGKTGLHRIINPHMDQRTVTIHIYSPPNYAFNAIKN